MDTPENTQTGEPGTDPNEILADTARSLFAAGDSQHTLQATVDLAVATIDGCDFAGLFILAGGSVSTPVHSDPIVIEIDALQHLTGQGPCLDALAAGSTFYAEDLIDDARWPAFGPQASAAGIRSVLAIALSANSPGSALNLYARYPRAFGVIDRGNAHVLAALVDIALSTVAARDKEEQRISNLEIGLISREVIGQAQGILMERERITSDQAFDILRRASQRLNVKLRDVAQSLVDTGQRPPTDANPPST